MTWQSLRGLILALPLVWVCSCYRVSRDFERRSEPTIYPVHVANPKPYTRARIVDGLQGRQLLIESLYLCEAEQAATVRHYKKEYGSDLQVVSEHVERWAHAPMDCLATPSPNRRVRIYSYEQRTEERGESFGAGLVPVHPGLGQGPYWVQVDDYVVGDVATPTAQVPDAADGSGKSAADSLY